jgi:hypothetical protein
MISKVLTHETANNTYYIGYGRTAKTTYEQQQEARTELLYMLFQKALGLIFTALMILPVIIYKEPRILLLTGIFVLLGLAVTLTKDHVITI